MNEEEFEGADPFDLYNASFIVFLDTFDNIAEDLDENNASVLQDYYDFFNINGPLNYTEFLVDLLYYINNRGNKSFEETYIIKDKARKLRKDIKI